MISLYITFYSIIHYLVCQTKLYGIGAKPLSHILFPAFFRRKLVKELNILVYATLIISANFVVGTGVPTARGIVSANQFCKFSLPTFFRKTDSRGRLSLPLVVLFLQTCYASFLCLLSFEKESRYLLFD